MTASYIAVKMPRLVPECRLRAGLPAPSRTMRRPALRPCSEMTASALEIRRSMLDTLIARLARTQWLAELSTRVCPKARPPTTAGAGFNMNALRRKMVADGSTHHCIAIGIAAAAAAHLGLVKQSHDLTGRSPMNRTITGFHTDESGHWFAELECGHNQHVRHNPPWINRPWVTTAEGRAGALGAELNCKQCDEAATADVRPP